MMKNKIFIWQGLNENNQLLSGEITADNIPLAKALLKQQKIHVQKITEKYFFHTLNFFHKISKKEILFFTQQLAVLLNAGLSILKAIQTLAHSTKNLYFKKLLNTIAIDINNGQAFAVCLIKFPKQFNKIYIHMIQIAEQTGKLPETLNRLARELTQQRLLQKNIQKALSYPCVILCVTFCVALILLLFVIPGFKNLYQNFSAELPWLTRIVIAASESMQEHYLLLISLLLIAASLLYYLIKTSLPVQQFIQRNILKIPIVGTLVQQGLLAKIALTLAETFAAGMPLISALRLISENCQNITYNTALTAIVADVNNGVALSHSMQKQKIFPELVLQMILVGEESGNLELMLYKIAEFYEQEVATSVTMLSNLCEPLIITILGLLIGGLVIAMYLPIFKLGSIT